MIKIKRYQGLKLLPLIFSHTYAKSGSKADCELPTDQRKKIATIAMIYIG